MPVITQTDSSKLFKILSIDGGGVRGVLPAKLLSEMENHLSQTNGKKLLWEYFDLITGTSTGGIIALAIALGIPANEILSFYLKKSKIIFGNKRGLVGRWFYSKHDRTDLEIITRDLFSDYNNGVDPLLGNCKTAVAIPIYNFNDGQPKVLKSNYHPSLVRDHQIPVYMAALATSAAPTFFDPYSTFYNDLAGKKNEFFHNVDGGVFANNPSLGCLIEVQRSFNIPLESIKMLSLGTGHIRYFDKSQRSNYGLGYWVKKNRLIEVFLQAQAQEVENLIGIMKNGIGQTEPDRFSYLRLDVEMNSKTKIEMDETSRKKLDYLSDLGRQLWNENATKIIKDFLI